MTAATHQSNGKRAKSKPAADDAMRKPPFDAKAEAGVLCSIILLANVMDQVGDIVTPDDFYDPFHAATYSVMLALHAQGRPLGDTTILSERLKVCGTFDQADDADGERRAAAISQYLTGVAGAESTAAHAVYYADIVHEKSRLRKIIACCTKALDEAYCELPTDDVMAALDSGLSGVEIGQRVNPRPLADIAADVLTSIGTATNTANRAMTGISCVDEIMGPILGGEMAVVAARTSVGKTSFAQQMLLHSANHDRSALLVSLEMSDREIATRELCRITGIDSRHIRAGNLGHQTVERLWTAQGEMIGLPFNVWAPARASVAEIRAIARKMAAGPGGLSLIAIDLIGHVVPPREAARSARHDQIRAISAGLKTLAKEMQIPVLVLSQLNREADGEEPRLSHLREGGRIEEDADIVLLLHAAEDEQGHYLPDRRRLIIAKHRSGQVGELLIGFHPMTTSFFHVDQGQEFQP